MQSLYEDIKNAHTIVLKSTNEPQSAAFASALYTFITQHHKKVFWVIDEMIEPKLEFLAWSREIRYKSEPKGELFIAIDTDDEKYKNITTSLKLLCEFYELVEKNTKLNQKIATSLYAMLFSLSGGFHYASEMIFDMAKKLLHSGANHKECIEFLTQKKSLATLRLSAKMLDDFLLFNEASTALFLLKESKLGGASKSDAIGISKRVFELGYVKYSVLAFIKNKDLVQIIISFKDINKQIVKFDLFNCDEKHIRDEIAKVLRREIV